MTCSHAPYPCELVSFPWRYVVGGLHGGRWSTDDDPPHPCFCRCGPCMDWYAKDVPVVLPVE